MGKKRKSTVPTKDIPRVGGGGVEKKDNVTSRVDVSKREVTRSFVAYAKKKEQEAQKNPIAPNYNFFTEMARRYKQHRVVPVIDLVQEMSKQEETVHTEHSPIGDSDISQLVLVDECSRLEQSAEILEVSPEEVTTGKGRRRPRRKNKNEKEPGTDCVKEETVDGGMQLSKNDVEGVEGTVEKNQSTANLAGTEDDAKKNAMEDDDEIMCIGEQKSNHVMKYAQTSEDIIVIEDELTPGFAQKLVPSGLFSARNRPTDGSASTSNAETALSAPLPDFLPLVSAGPSNSPRRSKRKCNQKKNKTQLLEAALSSMATSDAQAKNREQRSKPSVPSTSQHAKMGINPIDVVDALSFEMQRSHHVQPRIWHPIRNPLLSSTFRVCTYNVLCQTTIETTRHLYRHTRSSPHVLTWEFRRMGLEKELVRINADVFALQEIQESHFSDFFQPLFDNAGYECIFEPRKGDKNDGCAIAYRRSTMERVGYQVCDYFIPGHDVMTFNNVGQIVMLREIRSQKTLIVANTHILFNTKRGEIKLFQMSMLFHAIKQMNPNNVPVILCGDFNMEPHSALYDFVVKSRIDTTLTNRFTASGQSVSGSFSCNEVLLPRSFAPIPGMPRWNVDVWIHQHTFKSVYEHQGEISTYHADRGNPDFIFYSSDPTAPFSDRPDFYPIRRLSLPDFGILQVYGPWPNQHVPSDHIPLIADFAI